MKRETERKRRLIAFQVARQADYWKGGLCALSVCFSSAFLVINSFRSITFINANGHEEREKDRESEW